MNFLPYSWNLKKNSRKNRKEPTPAEKKLWFEYLKSHTSKFYRQRPLWNYIVDFYSKQLQLVIELDWDSHYTDEAKVYDIKRAQYLESLWLKVIRFTNLEVLQNFDGVCYQLEKITKKSPLKGEMSEGQRG